MSVLARTMFTTQSDEPKLQDTQDATAAPEKKEKKPIRQVINPILDIYIYNKIQSLTIF
jgi:hypothetical protein